MLNTLTPKIKKNVKHAFYILLIKLNRKKCVASMFNNANIFQSCIFAVVHFDDVTVHYFQVLYRFQIDDASVGLTRRPMTSSAYRRQPHCDWLVSSRCRLQMSPEHLVHRSLSSNAVYYDFPWECVPPMFSRRCGGPEAPCPSWFATLCWSSSSSPYRGSLMDASLRRRQHHLTAGGKRQPRV